MNDLPSPDTCEITALHRQVEALSKWRHYDDVATYAAKHSYFNTITVVEELLLEPDVRVCNDRKLGLPVADQTSRPDDLEKRLRHAVKSTCDLADILHVQIVHGHTGDPPTVGEKQAVAGVKAALDNLIDKLNVLFSPGN